jgi:SAM-dependent methyltransferase
MSAVVNLQSPPEDAEPDSKEMNDLILRAMRGVNGQAFRLFGNRVLTGLFAGMIIPERNPFWDDGNGSTKLLGCYEHELHAAFEHAIWRRPRTIINVGCAEGFYAIGLARLIKDVPVLALDIMPTALDLCAEYAERNGVRDRIALIQGCRQPEELSFDREGLRLYVIDCEGAELDLIDPQRCPDLTMSDLIIECHDFMRAETSADIADRLNPTHRVDRIQAKLPDLDQFQFMRSCPTIMSALMAVEKRPMPTCWLACWAIAKGT